MLFKANNGIGWSLKEIKTLYTAFYRGEDKTFAFAI